MRKHNLSGHLLFRMVANGCGCILFFLLPFITYGQDNSILQEFKDPGKEYSIVPLWSWNGDLKQEELKRQIDLMQEQGVYGAFMHARAGIDYSETPYFSDGWWEAMDTTMAYAARKNFEAWMYDEDKWPSGSAGGRTIAVNPEEYTKKVLRYTVEEQKEGDTYTINKQNKVKVFAVKMTGKKTFDLQSKVDLTDSPANQWEVPPGDWAVLTFEMGKHQKEMPFTQIDYLDEDAVKAFVDITHEEYYKRYGKLFGNTIPGVFYDEIYLNLYEADILPWTDDFAEGFKSRNTYSILNELPSLVLGSSNSASVNYDFFKEVTYRYDNAWFKQIADWCDKHNIGLVGHTEEGFDSYKTEGDYIKTIGSMQFPGTDNEEFRYDFPRQISFFRPKQVSSAAHIYGRDRSAVEAMGGGGYMITPAEYRYGMAKLGAYGINFFIPHLFHYTVDNIRAYRDWPPSWFFRNPYWKYFKPLADYGRRISFMNRQGSHVCHVALLYPLTDHRVSGYNGINYKENYVELQEILLNSQIDYDVINNESLLKSDCSGGDIKIEDEAYRVLILPYITNLTYDVAKKIAGFYEQGGIVIAVNKIPNSSVHGNSNEVNALMNQVFGIKPVNHERYFNADIKTFARYTSNKSEQNGYAFYSKSVVWLPEIIDNNIDSELKMIEGKKSALCFHQRRTGDVTFYLLLNEELVNNHYQLEVPDYGVPYKLDPETGNSEKIEDYLRLDGHLLVSMDFKPQEACFLTFVPGEKETKNIMLSSSSLSGTKLSVSGNECTVSGWLSPETLPNVLFQQANGAKKEYKFENSMDIKPLILDGKWDFQLAKNQLDQKWTDKVSADTIEIPIMRFYAETENKKWDFTSPVFDDQHFPEVKMTDRFSGQKAAVRYLSPWNASRIIFYPRTDRNLAWNWDNIRKDVTFRKTFKLIQRPSKTKIKITAANSYTLYVNETEVGSDNILKTVETYDIAQHLKTGENEITVKVAKQEGLIAEGSIETPQDFVILNTDDSWEANMDGIWGSALIHSQPSLGDWQKVDFSINKIQFPLTCWYRQKLPAGTSELILPERSGKFEYYVDGKLLKEKDSRLKLPENKEGYIAELVVKATIQKAEGGLLAPVLAVCKETETELVPWSELGLKWYTGRAIYKKEFVLPANYKADKLKIVLDPGDVKWFAEIWVNGQLAKYSPWGDYKTDITKYLKKGKNSISIVVSNLRANEAFYDLPDELVEDPFNRWWQQGATLREAERLESGLTGNVRLVPFQYVENKISMNEL